MRSKKVESAIKGLRSLSPSETDILIALEYIEKLEKQDEKDFTTIYIKGCVDKDAFWRDKIRDKIKELDETKQYWTEEVIDILKSIIGE